MPTRISALGVILVLSASLASAGAVPARRIEAELAKLFARYDAMAPGPERDELATVIDEVTHQRYGSISRLYWHTDLAAAKTAAHEQRRPILHLRMLGRLDEELSCANSRFFRSTLYANAAVSKFLRDNFVLYWSSERPVPRVTIDYGDGRKLVRTVTGNSVHYVMDEHGNVLDALPGLYAPAVFTSELAKSLALASQVRGLAAPEREAKVAAYHRDAIARARAFAAQVATPQPATAVEAAERVSVTKMVSESPDLRRVGIAAGTLDETALTRWATLARSIWKVGLPGSALLDAQSLALVDRLRAGNPQLMPRDQRLSRLAQSILADTAQNEVRIRPMIRAQIARRPFAALNEYVYTVVFRTPAADPWLGLLDNADFTGLPADGVVMP